MSLDVVRVSSAARSSKRLRTARRCASWTRAQPRRQCSPLRLAARLGWGSHRTNRAAVGASWRCSSRLWFSPRLVRDMLTSPCFGVLLVPPVQTLFSVQNKQFLGLNLVWDPQCLLRLRSLHVNAINPYVGYWQAATALQQIRQPVTMETRYCLLHWQTTPRREDAASISGAFSRYSVPNAYVSSSPRRHSVYGEADGPLPAPHVPALLPKCLPNFPNQTE